MGYRELSEYDIVYRIRTTSKSQVLTDFIIKLTTQKRNDTNPGKKWIHHVDATSVRGRSGVGIQLSSPTREILEQCLWLGINASNNETEYEALVSEMRLALRVGAPEVDAFGDSQLVANQFSGEYEAKDEQMSAYLQLIQKISQQFEYFSLTQVP